MLFLFSNNGFVNALKLTHNFAVHGPLNKPFGLNFFSIKINSKGLHPLEFTGFADGDAHFQFLLVSIKNEN